MNDIDIAYNSGGFINSNHIFIISMKLVLIFNFISVRPVYVDIFSFYTHFSRDAIVAINTTLQSAQVLNYNAKHVMSWFITLEMEMFIIFASPFCVCRMKFNISSILLYIDWNMLVLEQCLGFKGGLNRNWKGKSWREFFSGYFLCSCFSLWCLLQYNMFHFSICKLSSFCNSQTQQCYRKV